ncbi:MAG: hypothetical protein NVS9B7_20810 [Flavisolibacter sp.]
MITLIFPTISDLRAFKNKTTASPLEIIFSNNSITGAFTQSDVELAENIFNAMVKFQANDPQIGPLEKANIL